jgi:hypothetical protein
MSPPRPGSAALVPLSQIIADGGDDQVPAPGFVADHQGEEVEVTAVLTRTAVIAPIHDRAADKRLVLLGDLLVDPAAINWKPKAPPAGFSVRRRRRAT